MRRRREFRTLTFNDDGTYETYDPYPDDRRYTLSLLDRLSLGLTARRRKALDPRRAEAHIRCALEQRDIQPELFGDKFALAPYEAAPVPPSVWLRVAHQDIRQLGLKRDTASWLIAWGIDTVGALLLHTRSEVAKVLAEDNELSLKAIKDVQHRLKECGLRFPSSAELQQAFEQGFWKKLKNKSGERRVATFLVPLLETEYVRQSFFESNAFWPYREWGLNALGDVLALGEEELRQKWVEYCHNHPDWPYGMDSGVRDMSTRDARRNAQEFIDWAKASGLEFAAE